MTSHDPDPYADETDAWIADSEAKHRAHCEATHNSLIGSPRRRQDYSAWGIRGVPSLPAYAMRDVAGQETPLQAIQRAIESHTGLRVCACRYDGMSLPERDSHYQVTLGSPLREGGYSVEGSLWVAVPATPDCENGP